MDFETRKKKAKEYADKVKEKQIIQEIKHENDKPKKPWTYTKTVMAFIMINCTVVEIYSLIVMWFMRDLTALPALITAIVGECVALLGYFIKATLENKTGGIVYESAMEEMKNKFHQISEINQDEAVG